MITYKIIPISEAESMDFSQLEQTSLDTSRKSLDGQYIVISGDVDGMTLEQIREVMNSPEWHQEEDQ
jgi:uncharacterized protein YgbK (DUF1537 family)